MRESVTRLTISAAWLIWGLAASATGAQPSATITLETEFLRYSIGADARQQSFTDKATGKDYASAEAPPAIAYVKKGGQVRPPAGCTVEGDLIKVRFADPPSTVTLRAAARRRWLVFEVDAVEGEGVDEVAFGVTRVTMKGPASGMSGVVQGDEFSASARSLNLQTDCHLNTGGPPLFWPYATAQRGIVGAKVAVLGCPTSRLRPVLQELLKAEGLPWSPLGGPFALDAEENRGSYVFAVVSEKNVDEWIALARKAGLAQIHFIGWEKSLGHYEPRADLFPSGLEGLKTAVAKIHAAGLRAGMHTLTGGISRNDPFVTPVPDKRLAKDGRFTLAADIDSAAATVPTVEPPGDLETSWQYSGRCNVVQIGDELIEYRGLSQSPPCGLTGCRRGAFGTRAAPHAKGEPIHHLFAIYNTFQPDENSTLVDEVAECIARPFNACGFDMIYQDGAEGMPGGPYGWAKMREAVFSRLKGRVLVEASEWNYRSWTYHSRLGAYDYPHWGLKRFVDVHCHDAAAYRQASLLPSQLGWWAILGPTADHRGELPDELEYLCAKSLGNDMPMSFQGIDVGARPPNARQDEYLEMIGRYERLRLARAVPEAILERLRTPGEEVRLVAAGSGAWQFIPADYADHKVTSHDRSSASWTVRNRFGRQPLRLRIEALYSAAPFSSPDAVPLTFFEKGDELVPAGAAKGVTVSWSPSAEQPPEGGPAAEVSARSTLTDRRGSWAALRKTFSPPIDISKCGAVGLWIRGDGNGQLLNVQLTNPERFWPAWAEHYVDVTFDGWQYVELHLRERDAHRFGDYVWPYGGTSAVFRSPLIRSSTSALAFYLNALPPGRQVRLALGPVKALPVRKVTLRNPSVMVGGAGVAFPVNLESGQYLEFEPPGRCIHRDERGAVVAQVTPRGDAPTLAPGENRLTLACEGPPDAAARALVTVITLGDPLGPPVRLPAE